MNGPTEAVALAAAALAASTALGTYLTGRDPERAQADRALLRLARNSARKDAMIPAPIANDERSPDWCHRHGCHRSQCPGPE
jgi:hypothetical protein